MPVTRPLLGQLLCALALSTSVGCGGPLVRPAPETSSPPAAATFIAAHATGAPDPAAGAVSPLYRAELARRGRAESWPLDPLWAEAAPRLAFTPVATIAGGGGFVHALYLARPRTAEGTGRPASVWRVDLDPAGRVVWGEPVRLLADPAVIAVPAGGAPPALAAALPLLDGARLDGARLDAPLGVRSAAGDGYYGVVVRRPGRPDGVAFAIVDEDGALAPDAWSFGQPVLLGDPDDHHALAPPFDLYADRVPPAERALLRAYLAAIEPRLRIGS